jgi:hypothetical protein
MKSKG